MNNKEYTLETIQEFYDDVNENYSSVSKFMVWVKYKKQVELENLKKEISNKYFTPYYPRYRYEVDIVTEDIAIITMMDGIKIVGYSGYNMATQKKGECWFTTFDQAVIASMLNKYNNNEYGAEILFRAIGMFKEE